jgi:hypothetical protein
VNETITASFLELLDQSQMTASDYLAGAHGKIDERFGEGYAAKHPQLVAAYMEVAAADFRTSVTLKILEPILGRLAEGVSGVAGALESERGARS